MVRLLDTFLVWVGLLFANSGGTLELYHADLEAVISTSAPGAAARSRVAALQTRLQTESESREAKIAALRRRAERGGGREDLAALQRAIDEHGARLEEGARQLEAAAQTALEPLVAKLRAWLGALDGPGRRIMVMEDHPFVAPPEACALTSTLKDALDAERAPTLARKPECRVRWVFLLDFDAAVRASEAGVSAAGRVEALRTRLQAELDAKTREVERRAERERYSMQLELAAQYHQNQDRLRAFEEEEEEKLYARVVGAVSKASRVLPESRFVDASAWEPAGLTLCRAEAWTREVLDGDADAARLLRLCGFTAPR